jgi:hypothetical protein
MKKRINGRSGILIGSRCSEEVRPAKRLKQIAPSTQGRRDQTLLAAFLDHGKPKRKGNNVYGIYGVEKCDVCERAKKRVRVGYRAGLI